MKYKETFGEYDCILDQDGTACIAGYNGTNTAVTFPPKINGHTVTAIGDPAREYDILVDGDGHILSNVHMHGMGRVEHITLPETLQKIHNLSFYECGLRSIVFPEELSEIGCAAFACCKDLTSIILPAKLGSIADEMFSGCTRLTDIVIPDSVTKIGWNAFFRCDALKEITIPGSVVCIMDGTFEACAALSKVTIMEGVESIDDYAFYDCPSLSEIIIPSSVIHIHAKSFYRCPKQKWFVTPNSYGANYAKELGISYELIYGHE